MSVGLIFQRVGGKTLKRMAQFAAEDAKLCHKPKWLLMADMAWCALRYGAAVYDYHNLRFYNRKAADRKTFVTMGVNVKVVKACNDLAYRPQFEDKVKFNTAFETYLKRKWCHLHVTARDAFVAWCDGLDTVFAKRNFSTCGYDVVRFVLADWPDRGALYDKLTAEAFDLVEEGVVQHPFMSSIYPGAVNTLRLGTMLKDGESYLLYGFLRCAVSGYVDNLNSGGACCVIDAQTGVITTDGMTKDMDFMEKHPVTGFVFKGSQFPMWQQAVDLVLEAAHVCPQVRYVAWDVALTEDRGPLFIEANYHPGYDILQLADQVGKKEQLLRYV